MKEKNILELARRMNLISVDDMCKYTITQLVVMVANKVNELVGEVWRFETDVQETLKTQNEKIQYLLGEGLHLEVENIFDGWLQDGTFDALINQTALKKINERIDETNAQLSSLVRLTREFPKKMGELDDTLRFQRAIDECSEKGEKLLVTEDILISQTINLRDNTHIEGSNKLYKITTNVGSSNNGLVLLQGVGVKNITISNLTLENKCFGQTNPTPVGSIAGTGSCILLADSENICIDKCEVRLGGGYKGTEGVGNIWLSCCRFARITNNNVEYGNNLICVDRWYANYNADGVDRTDIYNLDIVIANNNLHFASGRAIALENRNAKGSVVITGNTISGCSYSAIDGRNFSNCIISNNVIDGDKSLKRNLKDYLNVSDDNYQWNTWEHMQYGIELLDEAQDCLVIGNVLRHTKYHGLVAYNVKNLSIKDNKIYDVGACALYLSNEKSNIESVSVEGNDIYNTGEDGIYITKRDGINCTELLITNNNIYTNRDGMNLSKVYYSTISNNIIRSKNYRTNRGINIETCGHDVINGNVIREFKFGLVLNQGVRVETSNKLINNETALHLTGCENLILKDNVDVCETVVDGSSNSSCDGRQINFVAHTKIKGTLNMGVRIKAYQAMNGTPTQPSSGIWEIGDVIENTTPALNRQIALICVGNSGTGNVGLWKTYGIITEN